MLKAAKLEARAFVSDLHIVLLLALLKCAELGGSIGLELCILMRPSCKAIRAFSRSVFIWCYPVYTYGNRGYGFEGT